MSTLHFPETETSPTTISNTGARSRGHKPACQHCGAALTDDQMRDSGFCCAGCSYVYRLVHEQGLAGYYKIKDDITTPADAAVFQARDYAWLDSAQHAAETVAPVQAPKPGVAARASIPELTLDVQGISCAGCVWLIERVFQQQPGARDINVNAQYGTMRLRWVRGEFSAAEFAGRLQAFGYLAGPAGETPSEPESRALVKRIGLCAAFSMNVMLFSLPVYFGMAKTFEYARLFGLLSFAFGTLSFLVGGTYFIGRGLRALRERAMHIDLPIALGIIGAYSGSFYGWIAGEERFVYFDFVSTFILLMLIGRWAQVAAVERNRRRLLSQQPKLQRVRLVDGRDVPPDKLESGQSIVLFVGQTLPVESGLESAEATFSLASINGEAEPRVFRLGQRVPSGAANLSRTEIRLVTFQRWDESLLAQLLESGERVRERHVVLERIVRGYLIGILAVAAMSGVGWWLKSDDALRTWSVVTAVLVVSCPCAIALAFPLADEIATVALRRRGVFVRESDLWSKLSRVRKLVFDKTGTLTLETPVLQNPEALSLLDARARSALFSLVRDNPHPVSQCLLEALLAGERIEPMPGYIRETIGYGVELGPWSLGRPHWRGRPMDDLHVLREKTAGDAGTVLAFGAEVIAEFFFSDATRADAQTEIAALGARGLATYILSGDRQSKVAALADTLGIPPHRAFGEFTPKDKAAWIDVHGAGEALMLGDGANDSLAFDRALCRGTPVVHRGILERKADFYYLGRGIGGLRALFEVNALRRRTQRAVLVFSIAYNLLAVGLAVAGRMNPLVAAALMPINSLLTLVLVTMGMRRAFRTPALA
jgi:Cu2+-exporting ATPase